MLVPMSRRQLLDGEGEVEAAIYGGKNAPKNRYRWIAQLLKDSDDDADEHPFDHECGGSLIHPRVVLTAGDLKQQGHGEATLVATA